MSKKELQTKIHKVLKAKNPLLFVLGYFYRKTLGQLYLTFNWLEFFYTPLISRDGYTLLMTPTSFSVMLFRYPKVIREDEEFIKSILREGDVYVDVGANIGTTTLAAALAVGNSGKVYAYEAHPKTFSGLVKSVMSNQHLSPRVFIKNLALGSISGSTYISNLDMDDLNFISKKGIEVPMFTLDQELSAVPKIDLLKIDVEGYEKFVLEGAKNSLVKTKLIYFESFEPNFSRFDYNLDSILNHLHKSGYKIFSLKDNKKEEISLGYRNHLQYENLLAVNQNSI